MNVFGFLGEMFKFYFFLKIIYIVMMNSENNVNVLTAFSHSEEKINDVFFSDCYQ